VAGCVLSPLEVEHAILRASQPRPSFFGSILLIPKFGPTDRRRALAPPPSPLLAFGLVAGTAFAPPLRVYVAEQARHTGRLPSPPISLGALHLRRATDQRPASAI